VQGGILWSWALPMAVAVLAVNLLVVVPSAGRMKQKPALPPFQRLGSIVAVSSVNTAVYSATGTFLPTLVTHQLGTREGGYFYVPWVIATLIVVILTNITTSMVREAIASPEKANNTIRRSMELALLVVIVVVAGCLLMPRLALAPLGPIFAVHGAPLLRWIGLATPATAIIVLYWAVCLVRQNPWPAFMLNLTTSAAMLAGVLQLRPGTEIDRVGMIYCIVQWGGAAVISIPTVRALQAFRRAGEGTMKPRFQSKERRVQGRTNTSGGQRITEQHTRGSYRPGYPLRRGHDVPVTGQHLPARHGDRVHPARAGDLARYADDGVARSASSGSTWPAREGRHRDQYRTPGPRAGSMPGARRSGPGS